MTKMHHRAVKLLTVCGISALMAPEAAADVTVTLTDRFFTAGESVVVPTLSGTLAGASINVTAVSGSTYSSDLTMVVTPGSSAPFGGFPKIGLAQIGGWWGDFVLNSNANTRLYWGDIATSETAVPLVRGPINFTSSFNLTTNTSYRVWLVNGYTSGTGSFTATITLHGVSGPSYYADVDGDGFGAGAATVLSSASSNGASPITFTGAPAGFVTNNSDCDDTNAAIGVATTTYYLDADNDSYGTSASSQVACTQPSGYVSNDTDCDDSNAAINPNTTWYRDTDGDGVGAAVNGTIVQCTQPAGYVLAAGDNCPNIANANQADVNNNGLGDVCEFARGDLNLDGVVNASDVPLFFNAWGSAGPLGDLNFDGVVNSADFTILLNNWGTTP